VRKSVEGFRMVVMAFASSSWTVLPLVKFVSVFKTYCTHTKHKKTRMKKIQGHNQDYLFYIKRITWHVMIQLTFT